MAGFYERIGIANHLQKTNPVDKSTNAYKSEAQTVTETVVNGFGSKMDIVNFLLKNWQLTIVGAVSLLVLVKRL